MSGVPEMGSGVPPGAQVAARGDPAGQALPEMNPGATNLEAGGAGPEGRVDAEIERVVLAERHHVAGRPLCPGAGGSL